MEHRICVCVAAIGLATIGHQAQAGITRNVVTRLSEPPLFAPFLEWGVDADSVGINAIGVEMLPFLDPEDNVIGSVPEGGISGLPASDTVTFPNPAFADLSDPSWSNLDPSELPPGPERAAAFGDNFVGTDGDDPETDQLTFDMDFSSLNDGDRFAFAIFFFEEGEETSFTFDVPEDFDGPDETFLGMPVVNVFQRPSGNFQTSFSFLPPTETRTRADFGMSVIPMPHPAGMAGVGLAGVAMVRRRRSV